MQRRECALLICGAEGAVWPDICLSFTLFRTSYTSGLTLAPTLARLARTRKNLGWLARSACVLRYASRILDRSTINIAARGQSHLPEFPSERMRMCMILAYVIKTSSIGTRECLRWRIYRVDNDRDAEIYCSIWLRAHFPGSNLRVEFSRR
ncbi:hypothetical protein ABW21_db0201041 [Orbilia brochopaga]|nr:hypothetical protein ABW21_db0201041 [Drechslerella brochopaga]